MAASASRPPCRGAARSPAGPRRRGAAQHFTPHAHPRTPIFLSGTHTLSLTRTHASLPQHTPPRSLSLPHSPPALSTSNTRHTPSLPPSRTRALAREWGAAARGPPPHARRHHAPLLRDSR